MMNDEKISFPNVAKEINDELRITKPEEFEITLKGSPSSFIEPTHHS